MKGLDLSKLQKISSDKNTSVFKHGDGHEIKIAHSGLSPKMRSELEKIPLRQAAGSPGGASPAYMADGGSPKDDIAEPDKKNAQAMQNGATQSGWNPSGWVQNLKNSVQPMAEGDPDGSDDSQSQQKGPVVINVGQAAQPQAPVAPPPAMPQAPKAAPPMPQAPPDANAPMPAPVDPATQQPQQDQIDNSAAAPDNAQPPQDLGPQSPTQASNPGPSPQGQMGPDNTPPVHPGKAPVQNTMGQPILSQQPPEYQAAYNNYKNAKQQDFAQQDVDFQHDLTNGHITPETYGDLFAKKDTLGKIGSIFGMMLSGAGSGLAHQPNALLGLMQQQLDRDLEGQKASKTNAQNFINLTQQHELQKAQAGQMNAQTAVSQDALAQMKMNRASLDKLVKISNTTDPNSPDGQRARQTLAVLSQGLDGMNSNLSARAAAADAYNQMLFGSPSNGGQQTSEQGWQQRNKALNSLGPKGEAMSKYEGERHLPGLTGQASSPLAKEDTDKINAGLAFQNQLGRFMDWTKNHSGSLSPADQNYGQSMAGELNGAYRAATAGGMYKEGEAKFIGKQIDDDPTKFFNNIRVMPKLQAVQDESRAQLNQLVKNKGFTGIKQGEIGNQNQGQQTKTVNGVKYMRGPNGEAIKVQ
jgi:hypothetical protein